MFNAKLLSPEVVKGGLVLWLDGHDFDNSLAPTTIRDRSGLANNGTCSNFANTAASGGTTANGIQFDGVNDIINCGHATSFNSSYISTECVISIAGTPSTSGRIIDKETTTGTTPYSFFILATKYLTFYVAGVAVVQSANTLTLNTPTHYVVTTDGTNANIYVNGVLDNHAAYTGTLVTNAYDVTLGNNTALNRQFGGIIYLTRIYNRALTATEVLQNYSASRNNS